MHPCLNGVWRCVHRKVLSFDFHAEHLFWAIKIDVINILLSVDANISEILFPGELAQFYLVFILTIGATFRCLNCPEVSGILSPEAVAILMITRVCDVVKYCNCFSSLQIIHLDILRLLCLQQHYFVSLSKTFNLYNEEFCYRTSIIMR